VTSRLGTDKLVTLFYSVPQYFTITYTVQYCTDMYADAGVSLFVQCTISVHTSQITDVISIRLRTGTLCIPSNLLISSYFRAKTQFFAPNFLQVTP
jgi:hypothetical protein